MCVLSIKVPTRKSLETYRMHLVPLTLDYKILEKNFSCIIHTNFLEFVAAKSNLNLTFFQLIISSYRLKIRIFIMT